MYHLFVSSNPDAWVKGEIEIETGRCLREYTDSTLTDKFSGLEAGAVSEMMKMPCLFAYETSCKKSPHLGVIRAIHPLSKTMKVEYEIKEDLPLMKPDLVLEWATELDIGAWEMNRTHWALKDVNLPKELRAKGVHLPDWTRSASKVVDISTHSFDVALSFPGEVRAYVEEVAMSLEHRFGPNSYFYDNNYVSQLARPGLDLLLQDIYRKRSKVVVVFLCGDYQAKLWCGLEFRAIKQFIAEADHKKIMLVRMDDGEVAGIYQTDGFVDARIHDPATIAKFIEERANLL